jgi:polysaccharide export outer membrane protein
MNWGIWKARWKKVLSHHHLMCVFIVILASGCLQPKDVYYLNGAGSQEISILKEYQDPKVKVGDQLSIFISSSNLESVVVFNLPNFSSTQQSNNMNGGGTNTNPLLGFIVDANGEINLPKIGKVKLEGLSFSESKLVLEVKLKEFVKEPIVHIRYLNFRVSVLGEVQSPGTFNVTFQDINIFQAIGLAGDLTMFGKRKSVIVMRNVGDKCQLARLDLTSSEIIKSPFFHLQSGDVVYVEPNPTKLKVSSSFYQTWPAITSGTTLFVLLLTLFLK